MDATGKSKYSDWRSNTNHNTQSHQTFNSRYDLQQYSNKPHSQSSMNNITHRNASSSVSNTNNNINPTNKYSVDLNRILHNQNKKKSSTSTGTASPNSTKFSNRNMTISYKNNNNNNTNKYMLSSKNKLLSTNQTTTTTTNRISDTQYNLSLIKPSDRVVLYCPAAYCYVCLSDFEDNNMDMKDVKEDSNYNSESLYLKCDDMEGVGLLIGETQFAGTCKFLADCKIQLITGQGLYKDRNRIIIHSKHATKFMLQKYDNLNDTGSGSLMIGHKVLIFVEASRSNKKQFWSYDKDTECIILKELTSIKPTENEIFILQKYGQPLQLINDNIDIEIEKKQNNNMDIYLDLYKCSTNVQEFYLCHDILRVLTRNNFNGDFIKFECDPVYGFPKIIFNANKCGIKPILSSAINALKPLIENTAKVRYFIDIHSRTEYGVVSQAFCAEIEKHLRDFNILIVQLETRLNKNELTLQNMRFYLQRALRTMSALCDICYDIHLNKDKKKAHQQNPPHEYEVVPFILIKILGHVFGVY
eukprot:54668_1